MSDKSIESVLTEKRLFPPATSFAAKAHPAASELESLCTRAAAEPEPFWADQARRELHWHSPFTQTLDASDAPNFRWFAAGRLNVSYNCLDVQLETRRNAAALIFEAEGGTVRRLSYGELHAQVCAFGNALRGLGVKAGDRV